MHVAWFLQGIQSGTAMGVTQVATTSIGMCDIDMRLVRFIILRRTFIIILLPARFLGSSYIAAYLIVCLSPCIWFSVSRMDKTGVMIVRSLGRKIKDGESFPL